MPTSAERAAWVFEELAARSAFAGENPFKVRSYERVADLLRRGRLDLRRPEGYRDLPGVGEKIAEKLRRLAEGLPIPELERRRAEGPPELVALLALPGVGPKAARRLWEAGVGTLAELEARLRREDPALPLTPRQRQEAATALEFRRQGIPLGVLLGASRALAEELRPSPVPVGELRRLHPTVRCPRWLAVDTPTNRAAWAGFPRTLARGFVLPEDALLFVDEADLGAATLVATGPPAFVAGMVRDLAVRGWVLEHDGRTGRLRREGARVPTPSEEDVFRRAERPFVPAHLREEPPADGWWPPPRALGDFHSHTRWSDGEADLDAMVEAALERGYRFLAVTDHAGPARGGLGPEAFESQRREVEDLRRRLPEGFTLLFGCEADIGADGSLAVPERLLPLFDLVIASVHSDFDQSVEAATARLLGALGRPEVRLLGHPSGRRLGRRPPLPVDWERVLDAARTLGVAVELNAAPDRLDLDPEIFRRFPGSRDLLVAVDSDAHRPEEFERIELGLAQAARAALVPEQVANLRPDGAARLTGRS